MPKRTDIKSILIIGAGPIVIGQACEFDYSGTQACKALKDEGYRIILVNSNPATIMTDPDLAHATYIEPITPEIVGKIIEKERNVIGGGFALLPTMGGQTALNCALSLRKQGTLEKFDVQMIGATADAIDKAEDRERFREAMTKIGLETPKSRQVKTLPDALLPTMGGQTALNTALSLKKLGVLDKFNVKMIGATAEAIDKAEDRELFREAMKKIGLATPRSHQIKTLKAALDALDDIGLPAIIRPSFTLGGTGGGIAYNKAEFIDIVERGIDASPTNEVLIEESVLGWKEFETEVVRDKRDNCIIICSIENLDPMGVHTGDSITIAPALTLTDKEYQIMRDASIKVLREIGVETGGSNVQFAVNPADGRLVIIEM
ncbi:MAG TPA: carbamoyl phosphate synthase large subunit, partial [Pseudolabrys sp.]|nr:carbamoyl phosphate synthase large subunit [Pseudolabrys sp.]